MSVINTERDLESLLVDMRSEMNVTDLEKIADALPTIALIEATVRRAQPGSDYKIATDTAVDHGTKFGILIRVYLAWIKAPAMRLGQLLQNATRAPDLFYETDARLASNVEAFAEEYAARPKE